MICPRTAVRAMALTAGVTLFGVFALAGPAAAHVTVSPTEATQGGYTRVAFRVPTESDTASTTKLEVSLPPQAPIANVSTMPVPGWTVQVEKGKPATPIQGEGGAVTEVITKITWTADGASAIKPGQFQEFPVSLGPLPQVDQLVFKALQTYSDGNVVRWIDEPIPGAEAESPAPVLKLAKSGAAPGASGAAAPTPSGTAGVAVKTSPVAAEQGGADSDGMAVGLAVAGLVAGLAGLALGGLAFARTRGAAPPA